MRERISPSLVISVIALIVALGGVSYAAIKIPKNSVGSKQLKKNAVGTKQLKKNAVNSKRLKKNSVNSSKVRDGSLSATDLQPGVLPGETWRADRETVPLFNVTSDFQPVVTSETLPAGSYVLSARANVLGEAVVNSTLICSLETDAAQNFTVGKSEVFPLSMSSTAVLDAPGQVSLSCSKSAGNPQIAQAHLIATKVPKVNESISPG
jgi:hypothetical protein